MVPTHVLYQGLISPFIRLIERSMFILEVLFECNLIFQNFSSRNFSNQQTYAFRFRREYLSYDNYLLNVLI